MELYIGGYAQGKLAYLQEKYKIPEAEIQHGEADDFELTRRVRVYNHFHLWVKRKLKEGKSPEMLTKSLVLDNPDCKIICDEIGNGIVPLDAFEREYRERTGRLLCELAGRAERVERVICGIGQCIK